MASFIYWRIIAPGANNNYPNQLQIASQETLTQLVNIRHSLLNQETSNKKRARKSDTSVYGDTIFAFHDLFKRNSEEAKLSDTYGGVGYGGTDSAEKGQCKSL